MLLLCGESKQFYFGCNEKWKNGNIFSDLQALELFLASRLSFLRGRLAAGPSEGGGEQSGGAPLAALLTELAALVQDTVCQVQLASILNMLTADLMFSYCCLSRAAGGAADGTDGAGAGQHFVRCSAFSFDDVG